MHIPHEHPHKEKKMLHHMPDDEHFLTVAKFLKLLSDSTRLQLFWILCHSEECVIHLASLLDVSSPAISHHLRFLKENELIISRKEGKEVYYKAADNEIVKLLHHTIEKIMKSACPMTVEKNCTAHKSAADNDIITQIHDYLLEHLDTRITIEELSHKFLMNPTTLKQKFKATYGQSIAAHIKEHRMEKAAKLLLESDASIAEISSLVGYTSQSKFSATFSETYGLLPVEYRKRLRVTS